ncbi:superoxide dismutase family protein [Flavobacteriaceae bacterium F89]|uniref:Superoxide dismutase family protein n=1 Tax=Cerina litoralis TaxID=2874477 RepID=A0AAE3EWR4_9FLAO|nr:superoxide dismutase family protein [Cerina litoralis]MCG2461122.1 superoxide dismutase family protein [Cerina litoralis]
MKKIGILALGMLLITSYSCKQVKKDAKEASEEVETAVHNMNEEMEERTMTITMEPKSDSDVKGDITFTEKGNKVIMVTHLSGLTPGEHAIHLHEKGDCSAPDGKSAGGHWNPTDQKHGKWGSPNGYHRGDIGNLTADAEGNATMTFETDEWCVGCDDATKNIIGKGVIVHQGPDDFTSQPSGAAGARVSCGAIME